MIASSGQRPRAVRTSAPHSASSGRRHSQAHRTRTNRTTRTQTTQTNRHPLPKTLTCALMALSVIASSLLAVALTVAVTEPEPAAAHHSTGHTNITNLTITEPRIDLAGSNDRTSDQGIAYTATSSNCDTDLHGLAAIDTNPKTPINEGGTSQDPNKRINQQLDYRCDWTIAFSTTDVANCNIQIVPKALDGTARTAYTAVNSIRLFKNPNHVGAGARHPANWGNIREDRRLLAAPASSSSYDAAHNNNNVEILEITKCSNLTTIDVEEFTASVYDSDSRMQLQNSLITKSPTELGITGYTFNKVGSCSGGVNPANQTMASRVPHPTNDKVFRHILDTRCSWKVSFTGPANHCVVAQPTRRNILIREKRFDPRTDFAANQFTVPFTLNSDTEGYRSPLTVPTSDPRHLRPRLEAGQTVQVINLEVLPEANGQCVSSVVVQVDPGESSSRVGLEVQPMKNSQPCESNPASVRLNTESTAPFEFPYRPTIGGSFGYKPVLGRNCNWVYKFWSNDSSCVVQARLYDHNDRLIRTKAKFTGTDKNGNSLVYDFTADNEAFSLPYTLQAGFGEENAATLRLTGEDDRLRFTTRQLLPSQNPSNPEEFEQVFVHHGVSRLEFTACPAPRGTSRVSIFDGTGANYDLSYSIDPVRCVGINPPPSQTREDAIDSSFYDARTTMDEDGNVVQLEDHVAGFDGARDLSHFLSFLCDWEVSFEVEPASSSTATMTHCQVHAQIDLVSTHTIAEGGTPDSDRDGVVYLEGDVPTEGEDRRINGAFHYDGDDRHLDGIYVSVVTAGGQCASDIELTNDSPAGSNTTVEVSATLNPPGCPAHGRGPKPASNLFLQGGEASTLTLARNCAWKVAFSGSNTNCVASALLKDTAGMELETKTATFAAREVTLDLAKTDAGLTYTYTPSGMTTTTTANVGAIVFNGCASTLPTGTVELTIEDAAGIHGFDSYEIEVPTNGCASGVTDTPDPQTQTDAIVVPATKASPRTSYIHRLNHNCDWKITFTASTTACSKSVAVKPSATGAAHSTTAGNTVTVYKGTDGLVATSGTTQVVRVVSYELDLAAANCVLPVEFINRSQPLGVSTVVIRDADGDPIVPPIPSTLTSTLSGVVRQPRIGLNLTPLNDDGSACTADATGSTKPDGVAVIGAMEFATIGEGSERRAVLNEQGDYTFIPQSQSYKLDKSCGWLVEFVSEASGADAQCFTSAQVRGHNGQRLGHAVLGDFGDGEPDGGADGPFSGGALWLASGTSGLTYQAADGTATVVGSIEFLGCLEEDYPGTTAVQIVDDTGLAGNLSYTIAPVMVDGVSPPQAVCGFSDLVANPPPTQTNADALVPTGFDSTEAVGNLFFHYLNYDCDWEITFTGKPACQDAVTVWEDTADGRVFADAVTETSEQGVVRVRLSQRHRSDPNPNNDTGEELTPGLGYLPGSGGSRKLASDATGVPGGNSATPTGLEVLPVSALSLECASVIDFTSVSGLAGPGMELSVVSPGVAPTGSVASACVTNQDRLPGVSALEAAESFSLALNRRCAWNITFESPATTCSAAVRVLDTATPPALIGDTLWITPGASLTVALPASADGLAYTPAGSTTATAVGALEFYNCFNPSLSLAAEDVPAGTQFTVSFAALPNQAGCTTTASQVVLANEPNATNAARVQSSVEGLGFKFRTQGEPALLNSLAGDGSLCRYDVSVTGPFELTPPNDALTARTSYVVLERPRQALVLRNLTSAVTSGLAESRQNVIVAVAPRAGCVQGAPAASPYTLAAASLPGDRATLELGSPACVWDVTYRTANSDCHVAAQFKDAAGSNIGEANSTGSLVITSRVGVSSATQIAAIEFTVGSCFSTFEASVSVSATDAQAGDNHAGEVITATIAPTASSPTGCSPSQTLRLTLNSSHTATASATLANIPEGTGTRCVYEVSFADSVVTAGGVLLTRTSVSASELSGPTIPGNPATGQLLATASYTASRPATVQLTNATLFSSTHSPASRRDVIVTTTPVTTTDCTDTAPPNSPHTVHAASSIQATLGTSACAWTISYQVPAADCVVSAQLKQPDGTRLGTPDTDGELTIYVDASRNVNQVASAATAADRIGSIEFTVDPQADCTTFFDASISVTAANYQADARPDLFLVTVAPVSTAPTGCSASQEVLVELNTINTATVEVELIDTPSTQTACSYTATFPEFDFSDWNIRTVSDSVYERSSATPVTISQASPRASMNYSETTLEQMLVRGTSQNYAVGVGWTWTLTPTPSSCMDSDGMTVTAPDGQNQTDVVNVPPELTSGDLRLSVQYLDYRCDWPAAFTYAGTCDQSGVFLFVGGGQLDLSHGNNAVTIEGDLAGKRLGVDSSGFREISVLGLTRTIGGIGSCVYDDPLIIAAKDGTSELTRLDGQDVDYRLQPVTTANRITNCSVSATPRPASPTSGVLYKHADLDHRCDYRVEFDAPAVANKCLVVAAGYAATESATPAIRATKGSLFTLYTDFNQPGFAGYDPSMPAYARYMVLGPDGLQEVNRLQVSYEALTDPSGTPRCVSPLRLDNQTDRNYGGPAWSAVNVSVKSEQIRQQPSDLRGQACTPNEASYTPAEIEAQIPNEFLNQYSVRYVGLGLNCEWLITFGSTRPDCTAVASLLPRAGKPFTVTAEPGETATVRLWPSGSQLRGTTSGSLADNNLVSQRVTGIEFATCQNLVTQTAIKLVNKTPGVAVEMEFEPLTVTDEGSSVCRGRPVEPKTHDDIVIDNLIYLEYACDWRVTFIAENDCEVTIKVLEVGRSAPQSGTDTSTNSIELDGVTELSASSISIDRQRYLTYADVMSSNTLKVAELQYTTSTDPTKCGTGDDRRFKFLLDTPSRADYVIGNPSDHPILIRNISTDERWGTSEVKIVRGTTHVGTAGDPCTVPPVEPSVLNLAAQETAVVYLPRACAWLFVFGALYPEVCAASYQFRDSNGRWDGINNTANSTGQVELPLNILVNNSPATFNRVPAGGVDVDGCDSQSVFTALGNHAEVKVIQETGEFGLVDYDFDPGHPKDFLSQSTGKYQILVSGVDCANVDGRNSLRLNVPPTDEDDAVSVAGSERLHYVDTRCSWSVFFDASMVAGCAAVVTLETAAGKVLATKALPSAVPERYDPGLVPLGRLWSVTLVYDRDPDEAASYHGRFVADRGDPDPHGRVFVPLPSHADAVEVVRFKLLLDEPGCVAPPETVDSVELVNRSEPFLVGEEHALRDETGNYIWPLTTVSAVRNSKYNFFDLTDEDRAEDQLVRVRTPFPQVLLDLKPLTAAGAACETAAGTIIPGPTTLNAMAIETVSGGGRANKPVLDTDGNFKFTPHSEDWNLDKACNWRVEFVGQSFTGAPWSCVARAQILGTDGERIGNPVGAGAFEGELKEPYNAETGVKDPAGTDYGPFGGGSFILQAGEHGLTYQGELVSSVEFEGCLPTGLPESSSCVREVEPDNIYSDFSGGTGVVAGKLQGCDPQGFPEVAELHVYDAVAPVGDLELSVRPAVLGGAVQCDGTGAVPAALDETDGLVFAEAPGTLVYHLSTRCDWVVTFERTGVCDAVSVWGLDSGGEQIGGNYVGYDIPVFVDAVTSDVLSVRLLRSAAVTLDGQTVRDEDSAEVSGGLVYFPGSGGGIRLASDALAEGGGAGAAGGAGSAGPQRVSGLAFECAPLVELTSVSGAAGPGLDVTVRPVMPAVAPSSGLDSVSPVCSDPQRHQRYPAGVRSTAVGVGAFGGESADELPGDDAILPGESFAVALNVDCSWVVEFESGDATCVAAARVLDASGAQLGSVVRTTAGSSATLTLTKGASGLTYPEAGGSSAGVAAAVEFFDCFEPVVSLASVPNVAAGTEFTVAFWPVGNQAGCSVFTEQTMVAGTPGLTLKQQADAFRVRPDGSRVREIYTRAKDAPVRLANLATDGSLCEYEVEVTGLGPGGQVFFIGRVSGRAGLVPLRRVVVDEFGRDIWASLSFANDTAAGATSPTAAQREVLVTLTPSDDCSGPVAEAGPIGPFKLGVALSASSDRTVLLGSIDCVWTVSYRNTADDCTVTVASAGFR